ncbi:MAG: type restriction-modification system restriction subunit [Anaerosolibacter sp.]|jgi:hypothetical protein|uniref:AAA family ATPase n=1 Tax=Anaerosolibacter sp. TaxID=1872527 RepID=UPI00262CA747|nr:AAA family ATPase [Anaerosolibacter sp.]MDF2546098.1 type restriction-modification system restriction subunit [Anaerosolibacter sp.]
MVLKDLGELVRSASEKYGRYGNKELALTESFRSGYRAYVENSSESIEYLNNSALITTNTGLKIYIPNQWFYVATYTTEFVAELIKYKNAYNDIVGDTRYTRSELKDIVKELKEESGAIPTDIDDAIENYFDNDISRNYFRRFMRDYGWWEGSKTIDRGDYYVSPVLNILKLVHVTQAYIAQIAYAFASDTLLFGASQELLEISEATPATPEITDFPSAIGEIGINQIVYGAPGTGKSHYLNTRYRNVIRVTFHPEYTYYDFVGSYKPVPLYKEIPDLLTSYDGVDSGRREPVIDYQFVPGPFTQAIIAALEQPQKVHTLLIEELNRANAPAVFGDIFQLLDRDETGKSEYSINPDPELLKYLKRSLGVFGYTLPEDKLFIPANLNIVATMNSADQGVFVMDSAFKRRWHFKYMPIKVDGFSHEDELVSYNGKKVKWKNLIKAINKHLGDLKINEDRHIGQYFMKSREVEDPENIQSKLLIYLWDDVVRHYRNSFFNGEITTYSKLVEWYSAGKKIFVFDVEFETVSEASGGVPTAGGVTTPELGSMDAEIADGTSTGGLAVHEEESPENIAEPDEGLDEDE